MSQGTPNAASNLLKEIKYDSFRSDIASITSKLIELNEEITANINSINNIFNLLRAATAYSKYVDAQASSINQALEYQLARVTDFSEGQNQLCRGLRSLLYSTAYPFLESTYILKFYSATEDVERVRKVAERYVRHIKRIMPLIESAMELRHNKPQCVSEWCEKLRVAVMLKGTPGSYEQLLSTDTDISIDEIGEVIKFNLAAQRHYNKLKPKQEINQMIYNDNRGGIFGGTQRDVRMAIDSPGANQGDADTNSQKP